jgi:hypothetical protein
MATNENMRIYEAARAVPSEAQKQFSNGNFSGTDINPMWRIKKMTELFGPCGIGWYYEIVSERAEEHHDMTMAIVDIKLYIKDNGEWSKPIFGTGGNTLVKNTSKGAKASDEGYKMALTDALSVACKALGVGADIYFGADKTKYSRYAEAEAEPAEPPKMATPVEPPKMATEAQRQTVFDLMIKNAPEAEMAAALKKYGPHLEALTAEAAGKALQRYRRPA